MDNTEHIHTMFLELVPSYLKEEARSSLERRGCVPIIENIANRPEDDIIAIFILPNFWVDYHTKDIRAVMREYKALSWGQAAVRYCKSELDKTWKALSSGETGISPITVQFHENNFNFMSKNAHFLDECYEGPEEVVKLKGGELEKFISLFSYNIETEGKGVIIGRKGTNDTKTLTDEYMYLRLYRNQKDADVFINSLVKAGYTPKCEAVPVGKAGSFDCIREISLPFYEYLLYRDGIAGMIKEYNCSLYSAVMADCRHRLEHPEEEWGREFEARHRKRLEENAEIVRKNEMYIKGLTLEGVKNFAAIMRPVWFSR